MLHLHAFLRMLGLVSCLESVALKSGSSPKMQNPTAHGDGKGRNLEVGSSYLRFREMISDDCVYNTFY